MRTDTYVVPEGYKPDFFMNKPLSMLIPFAKATDKQLTVCDRAIVNKKTGRIIRIISKESLLRAGSLVDKMCSQPGRTLTHADIANI